MCVTVVNNSAVERYAKVKATVEMKSEPDSHDFSCNLDKNNWFHPPADKLRLAVIGKFNERSKIYISFKLHSCVKESYSIQTSTKTKCLIFQFEIRHDNS